MTNRRKPTAVIVLLPVATVAALVGLSACSSPPASRTAAPAPASFGSALCYPTGMGANTNLIDPNLVLGEVGQYNQKACDARYGQVLAANAQANGALPDVARSTAGFVGIDAAYHATKDKLYGWDTTKNPSATAGAVNAVCQPAGAWDSIQAAAKADDPRYDPAKPPKYVTNQCANATYINGLLYGNGGLFTGNQQSKLLATVPSTVDVNGTKTAVLTWTKGYLLLKYGAACADCGVPGSVSYRVIIDAGSSGTRLSLYQVTYAPNGYPNVTSLRTVERDDAENGIDDYVNPDVSARPGTGNVNADVIDPLLDEVTTTYFSGHQPKPNSQISVDVLATAGMREAAAKWGPASVDNLYASIRGNLNSPAAPFNADLGNVSSGSKFSSGLVQTIDGNSQEGVWTWVNLNDYYCNFFGNPQGSVKEACQGVPGGKLGVVEVGGASTQVSFPVASSEKAGTNVYEVNLNGRALQVYNKTFIGLGQDSARKLMLRL